MPAFNLSDELLSHFNISSYEQANSTGAQKQVYIATIEKQKYALKIINIADERFEREVKTCEEFIDNPCIPNIIKIEKTE